MKKVYICEDNVSGIYSAIYDAWKENREEDNAGIALKGHVEQELFCDYYEVKAESRKAVAVENMIQKHLGSDAHQAIYQAILSTDDKKADAVLGMMLAARRISDSRRILEHLSHPKVEKVFRLSHNVWHEAHQFTGFARFRELASGVLFAEIEPKNQILTCIADHFANRLPLENWMIYDQTHSMFLVHQAKKQWVLVAGEELNREEIDLVSDTQLEYERLWKQFCQSICIEERRNSRRQMQHMPLRYRGNLVEMT